MSNPENQMFRSELVETDDSGEQQTMKVKGRYKETLGGAKRKLPRVQNYGLTSHAPKGSHGVAVAWGENPEQTMLLGMEHAEHRPKDLAEGEVCVYDNRGQKIYLRESGIEIVSPVKITHTAPVIVLASADIRLGGEEASRLVAAIGTIDDDGDTLIDNPLTTVRGI